MEYHIHSQGLSVSYPLQKDPVFANLNLKISPGEFVVIAGPSGSGKSTFCRTLIGLIPNLTKGDIIAGSLDVCGLKVDESQVHQLTQHVGMVFQDPETNIFSLIVLDELAFGPENMGLPKMEIIRRIEQVSDWVGLKYLWPNRTDQLSGGQKQRVAIGGALAMFPKVLVLDEPTTDLDPIGKKQVIATLKRLKQTLGLTILVIEHDLTNLIGVASRLIIMGNKGEILLDGPPTEVLTGGYETIVESGIRVPSFVAMGHALNHLGHHIDPVPLSTEQAAELLVHHTNEVPAICGKLGITLPDRSPRDVSNVIEIEDLHFYYQKNRSVLKGLNLEIRRSEFVAILGPNGSGKSTLLKLMVGLLRPKKGVVRILDRNQKPIPNRHMSEHVSFVFQDPNHQLFENTVWDEVAFSLRIRRDSEERINKRVETILEKVNLLHYCDRHPATLSRGEKRRLAVATALGYPIDLLLLDEPTTGQDRLTLEGLFGILEQLNEEQGTSTVFVTHDMRTVWRYATHVIGLRDGEVIFDGPTMDLLHPESPSLLEQWRPSSAVFWQRQLINGKELS
jgi:energy-coupling factor transporter ATP-binding protein EcfA2